MTAPGLNAGKPAFRSSPWRLTHAHTAFKLCSGGLLLAASTVSGYLHTRYGQPIAVKHCSQTWRKSSAQSPRLGLVMGHGKRRRSSESGSEEEQAVPERAVPDQFDWKSHWYPVAFTQFTDRKLPKSYTILNEPLAVWYDQQAASWRAVRDTCPHRLAPLSEGRVDEQGNIECPYHGWAFEGQAGRCTSIPQSPAGTEPPRRACATAYPCVERQGVVWVYMEPLPAGEPAPVNEIPLFPTIGLPGAVVHDFHRFFPYDYTTLVENLADPSHVPFTHDKTAGSRKMAGPVPIKPDGEITVAGFNGTGAPGLDFKAPTYLVNWFGPKGIGGAICTYCVPVAPGRSSVLTRFAFKPPAAKPSKKKGPPTWKRHLTNMEVFDDDNIFLHHQERRLWSAGGDWAKRYTLVTSADVYISQFRKWLQKFAGQGPFGSLAEVLGANSYETEDTLLDRYNQHTKYCTVCSDAVRNVKYLRALTVALAFVAGTCGRGLLTRLFRGSGLLGALVAYTLSGGLAVGYLALTQLQRRFYKGPYPPKRNLPDSASRLSFRQL